jgi:hypothetical protein
LEISCSRSFYDGFRSPKQWKSGFVKRILFAFILYGTETRYRTLMKIHLFKVWKKHVQEMFWCEENEINALFLITLAGTLSFVQIT